MVFRANAYCCVNGAINSGLNANTEEETSSKNKGMGSPYLDGKQGFAKPKEAPSSNRSSISGLFILLYWLLSYWMRQDVITKRCLQI